MFELIIIDYFAAAHSLRGYNGNCENLHGHNWKVEATIEINELNNIDLGIDFRDLKRMLKNTLLSIDHKYLNDLDFFKENNPSTENISKFIFINFKKELAAYPLAKLKKIVSWEEIDSGAAYFE